MAISKIKAFITLTRPLNLLQGAIAILVTATLMDTFPDIKKIIITILIVWAYTGGGNSINDFHDAEIDRINRPGRPIPMGDISRKTALYFAISLFFFGSLISIPILTPEIVIILAISLFSLVSYSFVFKTRPFWGNFVVAFILGFCFIFAATMFGDYYKGLTPALLAFGFNFIRELVKDMQDIEGDKIQNAQTIPLKYGLPFAQKLTVALILILMIGAPVPFILNIYGIYFLITLIIFVEFPLLYVIYLILKDSSPDSCGKIAAILKGDIFFGLLAILLGGL